MTVCRPSALLLIVAALLLAPSLVVGNFISHSSPQNLTWAEQFADQFRAGVLYPRWLPDSFDGLGGPAFYFYPPIAFWVDALLSAVTFNAIPVSYRLSIASVLLLWASGLTMHAWLRTETSSPRVALYGALAYMAAPYHLINHYYRGAYAEFAAYLVVPLVMLGIRWTAENRRAGPVLLAVAYAALPMSHLPTALLVSMTVLPMYVLYRGWRLEGAKPAAVFFARCAAGGVLGLGLAAIYLIPALTLQDWIPVETFWGGDYRIEGWFLLALVAWLHPDNMMRTIGWSATAYGIAAIGVLVIALTSKAGRRAWTEAAFWAAACLVCLLFVFGIVPWFWQLPFVAKVQFPWRLMLVIEFAAITAVCLSPWPAPSRSKSLAFLVAALALAPAIGGLVAGIGHRTTATLAERDLPADLNQFLPASYPQKPNAGYAELSLEPLEKVPLVSCTPVPRVCRATKDTLGQMRIEVDADAPTRVVLRRFFYPIWRVEPPLPVLRTEPLQLVSFVAPAGRGTYRLEREMVRAEKAGLIVSGLSLLALAGFALWRNRRQRTQ